MTRDLVIIFRTPSEIEANVIRGLLETHDIPASMWLWALCWAVGAFAVGAVYFWRGEETYGRG